jgi:hypothetical protein
MDIAVANLHIRVIKHRFTLDVDMLYNAVIKSSLSHPNLRARFVLTTAMPHLLIIALVRSH